MPLCDPFIQQIFKDLFNKMVAEGVTSDPHVFRTGCYNLQRVSHNYLDWAKYHNTQAESKNVYERSSCPFAKIIPPQYIGESFWQDNSLVTYTLFELYAYHDIQFSRKFHASPSMSQRDYQVGYNHAFINTANQ